MARKTPARPPQLPCAAFLVRAGEARPRRLQKRTRHRRRLRRLLEGSRTARSWISFFFALLAGRRRAFPWPVRMGRSTVGVPALAPLAIVEAQSDDDAVTAEARRRTTSNEITRADRNQRRHLADGQRGAFRPRGAFWPTGAVESLVGGESCKGSLSYSVLAS